MQAIGSVRLVNNCPFAYSSNGWGTHDSTHPYHGKTLAASSMSRSDHGCIDMPCDASYPTDVYIYIYASYPLHDSI